MTLVRPTQVSLKRNTERKRSNLKPRFDWASSGCKQCVGHERLHLDTLPAQQRERINLLHGSLTYRDKRLPGYDAAVAMEMIEHIDTTRLDAFEEVVFGTAKPGAVLITTPNVEYNVLFDGLPAGAFRHKDHRFEWTRGQFKGWSRQVAERREYDVNFQDIGPGHPTHGTPTQMGVFTR